MTRVVERPEARMIISVTCSGSSRCFVAGWSILDERARDGRARCIRSGSQRLAREPESSCRRAPRGPHPEWRHRAAGHDKHRPGSMPPALARRGSDRRAAMSLSYPARFMLAAAMNPCPPRLGVQPHLARLSSRPSLLDPARTSPPQPTCCPANAARPPPPLRLLGPLTRC